MSLKKLYPYKVRLLETSLTKGANRVRLVFSALETGVRSELVLPRREVVSKQMFPGNLYQAEFSIDCPVPEEDGKGSLETISYVLESLKDKTGRPIYVNGYRQDPKN
jgi:hypothetical protein